MPSNRRERLRFLRQICFNETRFGVSGWKSAVATCGGEIKKRHQKPALRVIDLDADIFYKTKLALNRLG
jgi:hypothetical protein